MVLVSPNRFNLADIWDYEIHGKTLSQILLDTTSIGEVYHKVAQKYVPNSHTEIRPGEYDNRDTYTFLLWIGDELKKTKWNFPDPDYSASFYLQLSGIPMDFTPHLIPFLLRLLQASGERIEVPEGEKIYLNLLFFPEDSQERAWVKEASSLLGDKWTMRPTFTRINDALLSQLRELITGIEKELVSSRSRGWGARYLSLFHMWFTSMWALYMLKEERFHTLSNVSVFRDSLKVLSSYLKSEKLSSRRFSYGLCPVGLFMIFSGYFLRSRENPSKRYIHFQDDIWVDREISYWFFPYISIWSPLPS